MVPPKLSVRKSKECDESNNHVNRQHGGQLFKNAKSTINLYDNAYLHVDKLDSSSVTRRDNMQDIHAPAIAVPRRAILEDLRDLWTSQLGPVC